MNIAINKSRAAPRAVEVNWDSTLGIDRPDDEEEDIVDLYFESAMETYMIGRKL